MIRLKPLATAALLATLPLVAQEAPEHIDLKVLHQIKTEAFQHSQVMDHLFYIADVYGPRVTGSPNHRAARPTSSPSASNPTASRTSTSNPGGPSATAGSTKKFYGALVEPNYAPLIGFPLAWTPGTGGPVTAKPSSPPSTPRPTSPNTKASSKARSSSSPTLRSSTCTPRPRLAASPTKRLKPA